MWRHVSDGGPTLHNVIAHPALPQTHGGFDFVIWAPILQRFALSCVVGRSKGEGNYDKPFLGYQADCIIANN